MIDLILSYLQKNPELHRFFSKVKLIKVPIGKDSKELIKWNSQ